MVKMLALFAVSVLLVQCILPSCFAWTSQEELRIEEHLRWGVPDLTSPSSQTLSIQTAYIVCFNLERRCPDWAAYFVTSDYLDTPPRKGEYEKRTDHLGARYDDYTNSGYDRGHLAPFKISGGIRGDQDVGCNGTFCHDAVVEINYMSNIAPQYPSFNRNGGLWYELESLVRKRAKRTDLWVIAGSIFWDGVIEMIGPESDIYVPHAYYKIIAWTDKTSDFPKALAFLFPHQKERVGAINDFLVSVDLIEALSGFDFFSNLDEGSECELESVNTSIYWESFSSQSTSDYAAFHTVTSTAAQSKACAYSQFLTGSPVSWSAA